ncbi:MAG: hypothetical protein QOD59_2833 [Mycobacterium sp.]|nr:hypothetical protein [Mycobacterium sp.]
MAAAISFFPRRLRCVKGQSSPEDVACGVFVGLSSVPAALTTKLRLADAVASGGMPAGLAAVGGVPWVDLNPDTPSIFRFGAQNRDELTPARVTNTSIKPGLSGRSVGQELAGVSSVGHRLRSAQHVGDRQILHHDHFVAANEVVCGLVVKVAAAIGDLAVACGDRFPPLATALRSGPGSRQSPLRRRQPLRCSTMPAGVVDVCAIGRGGETGNAQVDASLLTCRRRWVHGYVITGQDQHPAAAFTADLDRLDPAHYRPMRRDLDLPNALQIYAAGFGVPARAVSVFGPLHTVEPTLGLEPWKPWCLSRLDPTEERVECPVQATQCGLLAGVRPPRNIRTCGTDVGELGGLVRVANLGLTSRPSVPALLERSVVQLPMQLRATRQRHVLTCGRTQSKLIRPPHIGTAATTRGDWRLNMPQTYEATPTTSAFPRRSAVLIRLTSQRVVPGRGL